MPESTIDPITKRRIAAFGQRRRIHALARAILVVFAVLLAAFALIAAFDWMFVVPDWLRWTFSALGYVGAGAAAWFLGVREWLGKSSEKQLARSIEDAAPDLREDLLSAVELGEFDAAQIHDSAEFRQLLQNSVAERIGEVQTQQLLPWKRLKNWGLAAAGGVGFVLILAAVVGGDYFSQLMKRAAVPTAKIPLITDVEIEILEPSPASRIIRAGDSVKLRFKVSKPEVRVANLEIGDRRIQLRPVGNGVFETTLRPKRKPLRYRISAGDAKTREHVIDPHTPPVIMGFSKRYEFPAYLGREPEEFAEKDGHLKAIEGTEVELLVQADQVAEGEIVLRNGDETRTIPLEPGEGGLRARIPVSDSGSYQIQLVGARSRLPAEFIPTYQITAHPDKAPKIRLVEPASERVVQPDGVVAVLGQAEDDFGIAKVEQWVSRDGGQEWLKFPVTANPGRQTPVAFNWDLLNLNVAAGDLITTKLVAFDGRGAMAETRAVDLTINFKDLDPARLRGLRAKERAERILDEFYTSAKQVVDAHRLEVAEGGAAAEIRELDFDAYVALDRLQDPLMAVPKGKDVYDLNLAAKATAYARHRGIRAAVSSLRFARTIKAGEARKFYFNEAKKQLEYGLRSTEGAHQHVRAMIGEELAAIALGDLLDLRRQLELLLPDHEFEGEPDANTLRRFSRILGLAIHRADSIAESLTEFEVDWHNRPAGELHLVAEALGPRLQSLALDLETLRADDRDSRNVVNQLGPWWTLGPIEFDDYEEAFHGEFSTEKAVELNRKVDGRTWRIANGWAEAEERNLGPERTVVFLFRTITAPDANEIEANFSYHEGLKVWLNGEELIKSQEYRKSPVRRRMQLKAGQNTILVKLVAQQEPQDFAFNTNNARIAGEIDALGTPSEKLAYLSRQMRTLIDDTIRQAQPVLLELHESVAKRRPDRERDVGDSSREVERLDQFVARSIQREHAIERGETDNYRPEYFHTPAEATSVFWPLTPDVIDTYAYLDESRPDADSPFCRNSGLVARALEQLLGEFIASRDLEGMAEVEQGRPQNYSKTIIEQKRIEVQVEAVLAAYRALEQVHIIRSVAAELREMAAQEDWRSQRPEIRTRHPLDWRLASRRLNRAGLRLAQGNISIEAGGKLLDLLKSSGVTAITKEMERRLTTTEPARDLQPDLTELQSELAQILAMLEPIEQDAQVALIEIAPELTEMMRLAAEQARALEKRARALANSVADDGEVVPFSKTRVLFAEQQRIDRLARNAMNALRQDANAQNILSLSGRERARDADSALEWLRLPTDLAGAAFEDALFAETPREQRHFLEDGALNEAEIANRFDELANHWEDLNRDVEVAETRAKLRELEIELELRERLDREFGQLERVAEMARIDDSLKLIVALESELEGNGVMKRELDSLTRNAAQDALTKLQRAAIAEGEIRAELEAEAVRQGEIEPENQREALGLRARIEALGLDAEGLEKHVVELRGQAADVRENHLSLRSQAQQMEQRRERLLAAVIEFAEVELAVLTDGSGIRQNFDEAGRPVEIGANSATFETAIEWAAELARKGELEAAAKALGQAAQAGLKQMEAEGGELTSLDFTAELAELKTALDAQISEVSKNPVPEAAALTFRDAQQLLSSASTNFPVRHAGDLRVANRLYERANELKNAAGRLEATAEDSLEADREVVASETRPDRKLRAEIDALQTELDELMKQAVPDAARQAREVKATNARANHAQAATDFAGAMRAKPGAEASILVIAQRLKEQGELVRQARSELSRSLDSIRVQAESRARVAVGKARVKGDDARRLLGQARTQREAERRAIGLAKRRGVELEEVERLNAEAEVAAGKAAELERQGAELQKRADRESELSNANLKRAASAVAASTDAVRRADVLYKALFQLGHGIEERIELIPPRRNSAAGRASDVARADAAEVEGLAARVEELALKINPNVHTPSEADVAARQAEAAQAKALELAEERRQLDEAEQIEDAEAMRAAVAAAEKADAATHDALAKAEQLLREFRVLSAQWQAAEQAKPDADRARAAIAEAVEGQEPIEGGATAAAESLAQAAMHEHRLGNGRDAALLAKVARSVADLAKADLPRETATMLAETKTAVAAGAADRSEAEIRERVAELTEILFPEARVAVETEATREVEAEIEPEVLTVREAEVSAQLARALYLVQEETPGEQLLVKLELIEQTAQTAQTAVDEGVVEPIEVEPEAETQPSAPETPKNPETQPESPETQPEDPEMQPENPEAQPENPEAQPESPEAQPENPEAQPEDPKAQPEAPEAQPNAPEAQPNAPEAAAQPLPDAAAAEALALPPPAATIAAITAAADAQAQELRAERNENYFLPPVETALEAEDEETIIDRESFSDDLDRLAAMRDREWQAFREESGRDLSLGADEEIDGIYRTSIESYFRVISKKLEEEEGE